MNPPRRILAGTVRPGEIEADAFEDDAVAQHLAICAFGAPFAQVRVDEAGELCVPRLLVTADRDVW
jgi:hypothetical protein